MHSLHISGKFSLAFALSVVFLFSFANSVSATTTGCEITLSGAGDGKFVNIGDYAFAFVLNGWDTQGTKAYIVVNGVAYTWSEGSTYTIGNVNFYVQSVDVNYTGTQEATGAVIITSGNACSISSCLVSLSGVMDTKKVTLSGGNVYMLRLNGWDTQGTKAYMSVNDIAYTWNKGETYTVNTKKFYIKNVDVQYTGTQEATGSAKIMINQECTQQSIVCTDSDGGLSYATKGAVSGFLPGGTPVQRTDECSGNNPGYSLLEYRCQSPAEFPGAITSETHNCPNGCSDGACVAAQTTGCTDSDGGKNYYVKGNLIAGPNNRWDRCYEDNAHVGYLEENYCTPEGAMNVETYKCPNGCMNGACAQLTQMACSDSDGGINYYVRGTVHQNVIYNGVTSGYANFNDSCIKNVPQLLRTGKETEQEMQNGLWESFCSGNESNYTTYVCPNGCADGACIISAGTNSAGTCGNGVCETSENQQSCPKDCAAGETNAVCIGEGESLGTVTQANNKICCQGLKAISNIIKDSSGQCSPMLGTYGYCTKCGDGICKDPENACNCPQDCEKETANICTGCESNRKCYPFGYRMNSNYCSPSGNFTAQIAADNSCENNFECQSNVCVSGKCVSQSLLLMVINWFRSIFGLK